MAKKEETKKEVVEEKKKVVKLDKDKLERTKTFSKILYILARIAKVFMVLGVICMALLMAITPVVVKNFKVEGNTINAFGQEITYKEIDDKYNLYFGDTEIGNLTSDEKVVFDYALKELENTNVAKVFAFIEFAIVCETSVLVILYFVFKYLDKLFVNIYNNDTPFTNDNLEYLQKIAKLIFITVIISFACDLLSTMIFSNSMISFDISSLVLVLVLYIITYIFEYACMLQNKSKTVMFNDIDE